MDKEGLNNREIKVKATSTACGIEGTTANLMYGVEYSLYDLMFGMMLPSGNDAAFLIAELGGYILQHGATFNQKEINTAL